MDSMRRMNAYVKLNFQRCLSQGKTLVICICLAVFFYLYFGDVRGADGVGTENWYYGDVSCCDQQYVYVVYYMDWFCADYM